MSGDFTPVDEISDWAIASGHELVRSRLEGRALYPALHAARSPQAVWEILVTVARTVAHTLRPEGHAGGPIGGSPAVLAVVTRTAPGRPRDEIMRHTMTASQLIGCAASEDFAMCRALAAATLTEPGGTHRAHLVLRAMLEILIVEPVDPPPQEPTS